MGWGSRGEKGTRIPDPQHCPQQYLNFISAGLAEEVDVLGVLLLQALNHTTLQSHRQNE